MYHVRRMASRPARHTRFWVLVLVLPVLSFQLLAAEGANREQIFEEAKALLRDGQAASAYELLIAHEVDWSGGDAYDYLLGVAALDSDNAGEAIFSLQRLVTRRPAFSGARLELARAYFDVGDIELARIEFERLLQEDPPEKVATTVERYLMAINTRARSYTAATQYFIDLGIGYDSNAPAATDNTQFLNFTLSPNNLEQHSGYGQVMMGALWSKPLSVETQVLLNGSLMHRGNGSAHFVDSSVADVGMAWNWKRGSHFASIGVTAAVSLLDRESNKEDYGANASYMYQISNNWRFSSLARYSTLRFEDTLAIQDVNRSVLSFGVDKAAQNALLNIALLVSNDDARQKGSSFSNDGYGLQLARTWFGADGNRLFANVSVSRTDYDDTFFGSTREDDTLSVSVGRTWTRFPSSNWSLTLQASYSEKDSSVDLYDFDRWEAGIFLRKVFN